MKALNDKRGSAVGLREAFVQTELLKTCADLLQKFTERLGRVAPEDRVLDPTKLDSEGEKIRTEFLKKFEEKITGFELPDQGQHIMQFSKDIEKALERRKQDNQTALEGAQTRLFLGSPAVGGIAYFSGGFITGHPLVDTAVCGGITCYVARTCRGWLSVPSTSAERRWQRCERLCSPTRPRHPGHVSCCPDMHTRHVQGKG